MGVSDVALQRVSRFFVLEVEVAVFRVYACLPVVNHTNVETKLLEAQRQVELLLVLFVKAYVSRSKKREVPQRDTHCRLNADAAFVQSAPHVTADQISLDVSAEG